MKWKPISPGGGGSAAESFKFGRVENISLMASLGMLVLFLREISCCVHAIPVYAFDTGVWQSGVFCGDPSKLP